MGDTYYLKDPEELASFELDPSSTVIWTLCHYPDHVETDERARRTREVQSVVDAPVWLFGSSSASYPQSVELLTKKKMIDQGVPAEKIHVSTELTESRSLDTIQEMVNVTTMAKKKRVKNLICISNSLHLMQVHGFLRREKFRVFYFSSSLRDWRWWYVTTRLTLAPLAYLGIGKEFLPLRIVRHARAEWKRWRI